MDSQSELKRNVRCDQGIQTSQGTTLPQSQSHSRQRIRPQGNYQKQCNSGKEVEDEPVKFMSNLPNYLRRGKNHQEKVLDVGVLDWGRLEKWQNGHTEASPRNSSYSPSNSNTSSSFSADGSTADSSIGQSCSPACQRTTGPFLQLHLMESQKDSWSSAFKSFGKDDRMNRESKALRSPALDRHKAFGTTYMPNHIIYPDMKLEQGRHKDLRSNRNTGSKTASNIANCNDASCAKGQIKNRNCQIKKREDEPKQHNLHAIDQDAFRRPKEAVSLPKNLSSKNHPGECSLTNSIPTIGQISAKVSQKSILAAQKHISCTENSCPMPGKAYSTMSHLKPQSVSDAESTKCSSEVPQSAKVGLGASRGRNSHEKISFMTWTRSRANELSKESDMITGKSIVEKPRSTSPFRRLSISIGKVGKNFGSKDHLGMPRSISPCKTAKSIAENSMPSTCADNSCSERSSSVGRSRSSPLRRLLDPLLKPKAGHCNHTSEPLQRNSTSTTETCRPSNERVDCSNRQSVRSKVSMSSCGTVSVDDSCQDKKHVSVISQAILRLTFKNGLPLITFAVDNNSDVLVVTMKRSNSLEKVDYNWMYTFFTIREVKKKNLSWINQGGKGKGHDFISNVLAQMKVYDNQVSSLSWEQFSLREFVLFSVDLRQTDRQASECHPNDEVGAIVVEIPQKAVEGSSREGNSDSRCYTNSSDSLQKQSFPIDQDLISATVILPSSIHSIPSRGIPSSLIDRWRSGGSCDCGGWDLGCKLRVLSNRNQANKKPMLASAGSHTSQFQLFYQGGQENKPFFSLAPFKDGVFSVEFDSSLTHLQAFSTCIAILDSRRLFEIKDSKTLSEEKDPRGMKSDG